MKREWIAGVLATFLLVSVSNAQVAQLGRMSTEGQVKPVGLLSKWLHKPSHCDTCADPACGLEGPACGAADPLCGVPVEPGCGVPGPTCGLAGRVLSGLHLGNANCGVPEPGCGATGLGYSGGFGLCGGSCDSCGVGGYLGRNLHQVNPCACGGSLVADMARGALCLVDRAVGKVVGGVCGSLQAVSCHASGTLAALQSAAAAHCNACGSGHCDGGCAVGPACGVPVAPGCGVPGCSDPNCGVSYVPSETYPHTEVYVPEAAPAAPSAQPEPVQADPGDPFIDDPVVPQARRQPASYRNKQLPRLNAPAPTTASRIGTTGRTTGAVRTAAGQTSSPLQHRYLQIRGRQATFRR